MRLEVYDKTEVAQEKVVRLRLRQVADAVELVAVDVYGERLDGGTIAVIDLEHGMHLLGGIDLDIGLPLDSGGRIKTY